MYASSVYDLVDLDYLLHTVILIIGRKCHYSNNNFTIIHHIINIKSPMGLDTLY